MIDVRDNNKWTVYIHIVPKELSGYDWDKYYVGITSKYVEERWNNGKGYQAQYFRNAINKYGWNKIEHEIIAEHLTKDEACGMEKTLISTLQSNSMNGKYGYNNTNGGDGATGYKHTEEYKNNLKIIRLKDGNPFYGKRHSEETKRKISLNNKSPSGGEHYGAICIYQFDTNGNYIEKYLCEKDAEKKYNLSSSSINHATAFHYPSGGFLWATENEIINIDGKIKMKEYDQYYNRRNIYRFSKEGNYIDTYYSVTESCKILGFKRNTVYNCVNGFQHSSQGYIWRYEKDVIEKDGTFLLREFLGKEVV